MHMASTFLTAEWRKLAMVNYAVDKSLLNKYLPYGTELDLWDNTCYISLVGFMFMNTRVCGIKIPFHTNFEEVNLRFYVRYKNDREWKRGVVFIKEIVPRPALVFIANTIYHENYETMPMKHAWNTTNNTVTVEYQWKKKRWHTLKIVAEKSPCPVTEGSEEEFITEHYWGYTKVSNLKTSEYAVEHPRWLVYRTKDYLVNADFGILYGSEFDFLKNEIPKSVFLAEGSSIVVKKGLTI